MATRVSNEAVEWHAFIAGRSQVVLVPELTWPIHLTAEASLISVSFAMLLQSLWLAT